MVHYECYSVNFLGFMQFACVLIVWLFLFGFFMYPCYNGSIVAEFGSNQKGC